MRGYQSKNDDTLVLYLMLFFGAFALLVFVCTNPPPPIAPAMEDPIEGADEP